METLLELMYQMCDVGKSYIGAPENAGLITVELLFIFLFSFLFVTTTVINFLIQRMKR